MAEDQYDTASVNDFANRNLRGTQSCIRMPEFQAHTFEIKPAMITMLQMNGVFHGLFNEDANKHLMSFVEVCDSFRQNGVPKDVLRLRLFPISLQDKAKECFKQYPEEHLYAAWERYKMLMKKCPNHGVDKWVVIQIFCNRLNPSSKAMVDSITNGGYRNVPVNEVFRLLDQLSANNTQNTDRRNTSMVTSAKDDSSSQIVSILNAMNKRFDVLESQMQRGNSHNVHAVQAIPTVCNQCNDMHMPDQCPLYMTTESVNYMGKFQNPHNNPYSQTYNSGWRNHPNFSWSQGNSSNQPSSSNVKPLHPPGFQAPPKPMPVKEEESRMEKMLAQILSNQESARVETKATLTLHDTAIKNLEVQMGQLASQMNAMSRSNLPSDTIPNPKRDGKEECKAITLRSGMQLPEVLMPREKE
ncbi:uncharacterized protein LOC129314007 [Prosopis cineraria]|uniref:uncharacterized protein LOC129314007 n=1 Tax=Prosopis cineraria TaxID=364024 RepID=UPI00240F4C46|nr:uncharacterized protein LOC129314007 [Prosopis cineraria]